MTADPARVPEVPCRQGAASAPSSSSGRPRISGGVRGLLPTEGVVFAGIAAARPGFPAPGEGGRAGDGSKIPCGNAKTAPNAARVLGHHRNSAIGRFPSWPSALSLPPSSLAARFLLLPLKGSFLGMGHREAQLEAD